MSRISEGLAEHLLVLADATEEEGHSDLAKLLRKLAKDRQDQDYLFYWERDPDPDLSYLDQPEFEDVDLERVSSLCCHLHARPTWKEYEHFYAYDDPTAMDELESLGWTHIDCLCGITFLPGDNFHMGQFDMHEALTGTHLHEHQHEIAQQMLHEAGYFGD